MILTLLAGKDLSLARLGLPVKHIVFIGFFVLASLSVISIRALMP